VLVGAHPAGHAVHDNANFVFFHGVAVMILPISIWLISVWLFVEYVCKAFF
jgi:hypothetical protein